MTNDDVFDIIIKRIVKRIVLKTIEDGWAEVNGTPVHFDETGNVDMGPSSLKDYYASKNGGGNAGHHTDKISTDEIINLSQEQKQNLSDIAKVLGCEVGKPMLSDEALSGTNFSWNERQHGALNMPASPTNMARYYARDNPERMKEIEKYDAEAAKTWQALSDAEYKEINQYSVNCPSTVMAYELRVRGLDVTAAPVTGKSGPSVFKNLVWNGAQIQQAKDIADFQELTKDDPSTARYGVIVRNDTTKHTMVATREGGSLKIIDTQLNATYSPEVFHSHSARREYSTDYKYILTTEKYNVYPLKGVGLDKVFGQTIREDTTIAFYRIDTLTIDPNKISKYVKVNK